jgi:hypothetical protein
LRGRELTKVSLTPSQINGVKQRALWLQHMDGDHAKDNYKEYIPQALVDLFADYRLF